MEYAFGFRYNEHNWIVNARKPELKALSGKDTAIKQRFLVAKSAISTQVASVPIGQCFQISPNFDRFWRIGFMDFLRSFCAHNFYKSEETIICGQISNF